MSIITELKKLKHKTLRNRSSEGITYFQNKIKELTKVSKKGVSTKPVIGKLYIAAYKAKYEKTLPYYDMFPMFMVIGYVDGADGGKNILGINFHYLPIRMRQALMIKLLMLNGNKKLTEKTKLKISYDFLSAASKFKEVKPTIHSYIPSHFRSSIMMIPADEWLSAVLLPVAVFRANSGGNFPKVQVYKDSKAKI